MSSTPMVPRVALLSTGGTIASIPGPDGRAVAGVLPGDALLQHVGLEGRYSIRVHSIFQKGSNAIGTTEWLKLASVCRELIEQGDTDGIVITHGTDTLEDTAYCLHCLLDTYAVPIVVTGSQRVPQAVGTDAYANLRDAIQLAAHPRARDLGVLVCFNQSVFSAGFVRKVSTFQLHGFDAPVWGPAGLMDEGRFHLMQRPARQVLLPFPDSPVPRVDIVPAYGGAEATFLEAILESGPAGLVIDALGRGQIPPAWSKPLGAAITRGMKVVVCSSSLHGPTHESYDYPGTLHELVQAGATAVSHLSARKARIRLALLLATGERENQQISRCFEWHMYLTSPNPQG